LPLSDEAVALLKSLPRFLTNDFVFTFGGGKPVNSFSQHKKVLDRFMAEELGHEPDSFAAHDLRRTVRSRLSPLTGSWGWWDGAWNPVGGCSMVLNSVARVQELLCASVGRKPAPPTPSPC